MALGCLLLVSNLITMFSLVMHSQRISCRWDTWTEFTLVASMHNMVNLNVCKHIVSVLRLVRTLQTAPNTLAFFWHHLGTLRVQHWFQVCWEKMRVRIYSIRLCFFFTWSLYVSLLWKTAWQYSQTNWSPLCFCSTCFVTWSFLCLAYSHSAHCQILKPASSLVSNIFMATSANVAGVEGVRSTFQERKCIAINFNVVSLPIFKICSCGVHWIFIQTFWKNAVFLHEPASHSELGSLYHNKGKGFSPHTCDEFQCGFLGWCGALFESCNQHKKKRRQSSRILTGRLGQAPWKAALALHLQWKTWASNV